MTSASQLTATRSENDSLGPVELPADVYYGAHTARAVANFPITGRTIGEIPELVTALAEVKQAAAKANGELGAIPSDVAEAIVAAATDVANGELHSEFVVDVIQGGAGTSSNMNANEVLANRALEILGLPRGEYAKVHPIDHVNRGQSTNDVYPSALRIALYRTLGGLLEALAHLADTLREKSAEFADVITMGRTQMQDAVPMTLGLSFGSYAHAVEADLDLLRTVRENLLEVNLGGTAIGTELNTVRGYTALARQHLAEVTGLPVYTASNLMDATQDTGGFVTISGALKRTAMKLSKFSNDLRLLSSGPQAGFGDIQLPAMQAGSSIMPGKVNPVIPEVVSQVAFVVAGNDLTITMAAEGGQLQLNAFEPVLFVKLYESITELTNAVRVLADRCVYGITADSAALEERVHRSAGLATVLSPLIGYSNAAKLAKEAVATGASIVDLVLREGLVEESVLRAELEPSKLVNPHGN